MTLEEEQRLLVLLSSFTLTILNNTTPNKADVLDYIQNSNWANFSQRQLQIKKNRNELIWRNEFAFTKKHLMDEQCIVNIRNNWSITTKGRSELKKLCNMVFTVSNCNIISNNCISYSKNVFPQI